MKRTGTAIILSTALALLGCGGGTSNVALKGNWTAVLYNPDGTRALALTATLAQSGSTVNVTNLSFVPSSSCFAEGTTATGVFTPNYTTHGVTSGPFQMTLQSGPSNVNGMNTLSLQGTFLRNVISGTWTVTGTGLDCTGGENLTSGVSFVMTQM